MKNTISNIYSVDIYGQLHLERSTAACSFLQKFDLGSGKNGTSRNSINFYFFIFTILGWTVINAVKWRQSGGGGDMKFSSFLKGEQKI